MPSRCRPSTKASLASHLTTLSMLLMACAIVAFTVFVLVRTVSLLIVYNTAMDADEEAQEIYEKNCPRSRDAIPCRGVCGV